jgi:hypothetical protein
VTVAGIFEISPIGPTPMDIPSDPIRCDADLEWRQQG